MSISLHKAESIGVLLESMGYGAYLIIFWQCVNVLRQKRSWSMYLILTTMSLFILCTMHLAIDVDRSMDAYANDVWTPNGAELYYQNLGTWKNVFKSTVYVATTVASDAFIVYRLYIVWARHLWLIVLPVLLFMADIGVGILWCWTLSKIHPGEDFYNNAFATRVKVFYAITLALNFICTILIAYKVHRIQRRVSQYTLNKNDNELSRVVPMIVESGAVYSAYLVIMLATFSSGSNVMFIFLNSISPVIGIVFSAVIVRVGLGISHGDQSTSQNPRQPTRASHAPRDSFPDGVQISLEQTIHTTVDPSEGDTASVEHNTKRPAYAV